MNYSDSNNISWVAYIPGFEDVIFKLQYIEIPGIRSSPIKLPNHSEYLVPQPGDRIEYDDVTLGFIIDSDLQNYFHLKDWFNNATTHYDNNGLDYRRDIIVNFLDQKENLQNFTITYEDCFPVDISRIELDVSEPTKPIQCNVTFTITKFSVVRLEHICQPIKTALPPNILLPASTNVDVTGVNLVIETFDVTILTDGIAPPIANAGVDQTIYVP